MKRREYLIGITGVVSSSGVALGTGAFTSSEVKRTVTVEVEDDDDAYLSLDPSSDLTRSTVSSGELEFYIPGLKTRSDLSDVEGEGISPNSTYTFNRLVDIRNMGTDTITVFSNSPSLDSGFERLTLIESDSQELLTDLESSRTLNPGESFSAGLFIETGTSSTTDYQLSLEIRAESNL